MTTLYRPVLIESAEQAEAMPIGTVAIESSHQELAEAKDYGPGAPLVRCARYEPYTWHNDYDGSVGHDYVIGYVALVPIEAEEVRVIASGGLERDYHGATVLNHTPDGPRRDYRRTEFHTPWEEA